jgi:hypothetical protein
MAIGKQKATITNASGVDKDALFTEGILASSLNGTAIEIRCLHRPAQDVNAFSICTTGIDIRCYERNAAEAERIRGRPGRLTIQ